MRAFWADNVSATTKPSSSSRLASPRLTMPLPTWLARMTITPFLRAATRPGSIPVFATVPGPAPAKTMALESAATNASTATPFCAGHVFTRAASASQ
jgi:hypothetical protein